MTRTEAEPRWFNKNGTEKMVLTFRSYEDVRQALYLPETMIRKKHFVISLGEGMSDFADNLAQKTGARVLAVDPLYELGDEILVRNEKELRKRVEARYNHRITVSNIAEHRILASMNPEPPMRKKENMVAGSVYELPFPSQSVDYIFAHRLFEHIDFPRALPELLRVIRPRGEIRFSGLGMYVFRHEHPPSLSQYILEEKSDKRYYWTPHPGWKEQLECLSFHSQVQTTIVSSEEEKSPLFRDLPELAPEIEFGRAIILRQDQYLPWMEETAGCHFWRLAYGPERQDPNKHKLFTLESLVS